MPWGKAGERITAEEARHRAAERARQRRARTNKAEAKMRATVEQRTAEAKLRWENGLARPDAITLYLDARGLYGPEVDAACGVAEPTVDLWEEGRVYPTWEQLLALAELCGVGVWMFTTDHPALDGRFFLCGRGVSHDPPPEPVTRFDPLALAAAGIAPWPAALAVATEENGQGRLL